jgi:hypothetical protein
MILLKPEGVEKAGSIMGLLWWVSDGTTWAFVRWWWEKLQGADLVQLHRFALVLDCGLSEVRRSTLGL